ncbi:MAG: nicotinamide-nucleotide amidohydrolase family protein, partial [Rubrivivax sp.]|nr:nicotinamide-nucleotide amidohydrolase family protein [Rubrivivax sp.]
RGFVSYSNASKTELLGVAAPLIERHGAVSEAVVAAMALGALERAPVQLAAAVSGIAGPGGAVPGKPVGTVWVAWAARVEGVPSLWRVERLTLGGDRSTIRESAAARVLGGLLDAVSAAPG